MDKEPTVTTPNPMTRTLTLGLVALAACGPGEGTHRAPAEDRETAADTAQAPSVVEAPHSWLQSGFMTPGTSADEMRERFGPPDARTAIPTPNRHVPDQTDTLVTLEYDRGITVQLYSVTGGEDLLQSVEVSSPGILQYDAPVDVGAEWERVTSILGPPSGRRNGIPFYECEGCPAAESPVYFEVADGVVRRIRFSYYVD